MKSDAAKGSPDAARDLIDAVVPHEKDESDEERQLPK